MANSNIAKLKWFNNAQVLILCLALIGGTWGVSEYMNTSIVKSSTWVRIVKHVDESPKKMEEVRDEISDIDYRVSTAEGKICDFDKLIPEINKKLDKLVAIEAFLKGAKIISLNSIEQNETYN